VGGYRIGYALDIKVEVTVNTKDVTGRTSLLGKQPTYG